MVDEYALPDDGPDTDVEGPWDEGAYRATESQDAQGDSLAWEQP